MKVGFRLLVACFAVTIACGTEKVDQKEGIRPDELRELSLKNGNIRVDGLPTVHIKDMGSIQAIPSDRIYFIKGKQIFIISFLHGGGERPEDWSLYDRFLQSFRFY